MARTCSARTGASTRRCGGCGCALTGRSPTLVDQRNLAGIGNLYRAETLFLRGVSPWTPVGEVADLPAMVSLAQRLLASNKGRWTQATTGSLRRGEEQWVFERAGKPCRRCGTTIRRWTGGDHDRITYWCPNCQLGAASPV